MTTFFEWAFSSTSQNIRIGFEDVVFARAHPDKYTFIHTLPSNKQSYLITGTLTAEEEEAFMNTLLTQYQSDPPAIILYGKNATDETPYKKHTQLRTLGISNVWVYSGGLFEWALLQDVYGEKEFPTTQKDTDILKWRPEKTFQ